MFDDFFENDEYIVNLPIGKAFSIVREMITEKTQIVISLFGFELEDNSIYGHIDNNKISYFNRAKYTQGIYYKTVMEFIAFENNKCKIIVNNRKIKFYVILWIIMTLISVLVFSIAVFTQNQYYVSTNDVKRVVDGHPYFLYIFPAIISIMFLIIIKIMHSLKNKSKNIFNIIINKLKAQENI